MEEVMKLPANYRISIYLYYYEGYSASEIADILGKKESESERSMEEKEARRLVADYADMI